MIVLVEVGYNNGVVFWLSRFLQKVLAGFRQISISSLIRLYSRPERYQSIEETISFHLATLSLQTDLYCESYGPKKVGW